MGFKLSKRVSISNEKSKYTDSYRVTYSDRGINNIKEEYIVAKCYYLYTNEHKNNNN